MLLNKQKFLFISGPSGLDNLMLNVYNELKKEDKFEIYFISPNEGSKLFLSNSGISEDKIRVVDFQKQRDLSEPDISYLKNAEEKYNIDIWFSWGITSIRKKNRSKISKNKILRRVEYCIRKYNDVLDELKPEYMICYDAPAGFSSLVLQKIAQSKGIKTLYIQTSKIPNMFGISDGVNNRWPRLIEEYDNIKKNGLLDYEKEKAEHILDEYENKEIKPSSVITYSEDISGRIKRLSSYGMRIWYNKKLPDYELSIKPHLVWPIKQRLYNNMKIFEKPVKGEKYVLYPLHFHPEVSTLLHGRWYVNQVALIENIAKSLPVNYKLYVKEHSVGFGNRKLSFYNDIKNISNVRIIFPKTSIKSLIKDSSLVLAITGTSAWEGLMFQKPVITFGDVFFNAFDSVINIQDISKLPQEIKKIIGKTTPRSEIIKYIGALLRASYDGIARLPDDCKNMSIKEDNIKLLGKGIIDYINKD